MEKSIKYNKKITQRYDWVDVLKFLGIFAIYLGHCGNIAGKLYPFVYISCSFIFLCIRIFC